jgi:7-cyano-7-deazaguanine synthase
MSKEPRGESPALRHAKRSEARAPRRGAACVLVSGGLDSAVLLRDALRAYRRVQPLYVRAGMRWEEVEIAHLRRFLRGLRSRRLGTLAIIDLPMADLYGDHWSTGGRRPPGFRAGDASVYLPGRNIALFSKAATFCALRRIPVLVSGILSANPFPDGTPAFLRAMERALARGIGAPLRIRTPYRGLTKDRVVWRGRDLPLRRTFSCINPRRDGRHCGDCCKCAERLKAFRRAGVPDPTDYAGGPAAGSRGTSPGARRSSREARSTTIRVAPNRTTSSR